MPQDIVETLVKERKLQMNPDMQAVLLFVNALNVYRIAFQNLDNHEDPEENGYGDMDAERFERRVAEPLVFGRP